MNDHVILLQPAWERATEETVCMPLGLAWVGSTLREAGYSVSIVDLLLKNKSDWKTILSSSIEEHSPFVVGIQFHSIVSLKSCCEACAFIKENFPDILLVGGGETASRRADYILENGYVNYIVDGEGEITFPELLHSLKNNMECINEVQGIIYRHGGIVVRNIKRKLIESLDILPFPARDLFEFKEYPQWSVLTSRGCPYTCTFCSPSDWWQHKIRYRSIKNVISEIEEIVNKFGITDIYVGDDIFTHNKKRVYAFCQGLKDKGLKIRWTCLTRADCVDFRLLKTMHDSGCCEISIGLESANDDTLALINKGESVKDIKKAINMCEEIGIQTRVTIIFGLPKENEEKLFNTLTFLENCQPNQVQLYSLALYDGTMLFGDTESLGIKIIYNEPEQWSRNVLDPMCETETLPRKNIIKMAHIYVERLKKLGYIHFDSTCSKIKNNLEHVVYTGFCPVQSIPDARKKNV